MNNFNVANWFAERSKLKIQSFTVENIDFELMALTEVMIESAKECDSYKEILHFAADSGISYSRKRVIDDEDLAKDISMLWGKDELDSELDPCIRLRVGDKVCAISGLTSYIQERLEAELEEEIRVEEEKAEEERKKKLKVGDHLVPGDTDLDNMTAEQMAQNHKDNA
jgi:hypothetical protein